MVHTIERPINFCVWQRIASDELNISDEEMDIRLGQLTNLLPGLEVNILLETSDIMHAGTRRAIVLLVVRI